MIQLGGSRGITHVLSRTILEVHRVCYLSTQCWGKGTHPQERDLSNVVLLVYIYAKYVLWCFFFNNMCVYIYIHRCMGL